MAFTNRQMSGNKTVAVPRGRAWDQPMDAETASAKDAAHDRRLAAIALDRLVIDGDENLRKRYDLEKLKASLKAAGQLQPIVVVPLSDRPGYHKVIAGFSRAKAAAELGFSTIMAVVVNDAGPRGRTLTQLSENLARSNFTVYEVARGIQSLLDSGMTRQEVCSYLGHSTAWLSQHLGVLNLPAVLQKEAQTGNMGLTDVRFLNPYAKLLPENELIALAKSVEGKDEAARTIIKKELDLRFKRNARPRRTKSTEVDIRPAPPSMDEDRVPRSRSEICHEMRALGRKLETSTKPEMRSRISAQLMALQWVMGDDLVDLG